MEPVLELLVKQSASRLRDMDEQIDAQLADLRVQSAWIKRALAQKAGPSPSDIRPLPEAKPGAKRRRGSKRDAILRLLHTDPARVWLPSEVRDGLAGQGVQSTAEAVRVALRRMGEEGGTLVRGPDGNGWKLASNGEVPASTPTTPLPQLGGSAPVSGQPLRDH